LRHPLSDRQLAVQMAHGDETAFHELLARYRPTAYSVAYSVLSDPEDAEAAVTEAFRELRRLSGPTVASLGSVATWLLSLTRLRARVRSVARLH
jgi:DNA-directed RNA polymerase specialized sigma24 family protein